jgi:hypothetical protein
MPKAFPEELMRQARLKQGLPPEPPPSEIGRRFGQLIVVSHDWNSSWNCKCLACGSIASYWWAALLKRTNPTCGCVPLPVLRQDKVVGPGRISRARIGLTFGQLTTVAYDGYFFQCSCAACGGTKFLTWAALVKRKKPHCGCGNVQPPAAEPVTQATRKSLYVPPHIYEQPRRRLPPPARDNIGAAFHEALNKKAEQIAGFHGSIPGRELAWAEETWCRPPRKIRDVRRLQDV